MNERRLRRRSDLRVVKGAVFFALLFILCISAAKSTTTTKAAGSGDGQAQVKYYTSVYIESGDTLWSIAKKYKPNEYSDIRDYIDEIEQINNLQTDQICTGGYICIPYYK